MNKLEELQEQKRKIEEEIRLLTREVRAGNAIFAYRPHRDFRGSSSDDWALYILARGRRRELYASESKDAAVNYIDGLIADLQVLKKDIEKWRKP